MPQRAGQLLLDVGVDLGEGHVGAVLRRFSNTGAKPLHGPHWSARSRRSGCRRAFTAAWKVSWVSSSMLMRSSLPRLSGGVRAPGGCLGRVLSGLPLCIVALLERGDDFVGAQAVFEMIEVGDDHHFVGLGLRDQDSSRARTVSPARSMDAASFACTADSSSPSRGRPCCPPAAAGVQAVAAHQRQELHLLRGGQALGFLVGVGRDHGHPYHRIGPVQRLRGLGTSDGTGRMAASSSGEVPAKEKGRPSSAAASRALKSLELQQPDGDVAQPSPG